MTFFGGGGGGGGGRFFKNFVDFFFRSTEFIFQALPGHYTDPIFTKFLRRRQIKRGQKCWFLALLKKKNKKMEFFRRALPFKISIKETNLRKKLECVAFRKTLGLVGQKWMS